MENEKTLPKPLIGREMQIIDDVLNYGLPIGEKGILVRYDANNLELRKFLVRIPSKRQDFWCTAFDIVETSRHLADIVKDRDKEPLAMESEVDTLLSNITFEFLKGDGKGVRQD